MKGEHIKAKSIVIRLVFSENQIIKVLGKAAMFSSRWASKSFDKGVPDWMAQCWYFVVFFKAGLINDLKMEAIDPPHHWQRHIQGFQGEGYSALSSTSSYLLQPLSHMPFPCHRVCILVSYVKGRLELGLKISMAVLITNLLGTLWSDFADIWMLSSFV